MGGRPGLGQAAFGQRPVGTADIAAGRVPIALAVPDKMDAQNGGHALISTLQRESSTIFVAAGGGPVHGAGA